LINPCRVVVTIHDIIHLLYPEYLPNKLAFFYAQRMIQRSLHRGDRIITVSQNTKTDLMRYFDLGGGKIQVVHNGVDDVFRERLSEEERNRWLQNLGVPQPYLLFVGNPKPHKNLRNVLAAYGRARQLHDFDAPLVCVGDRGNAEAQLRHQAREMGFEDKLLLLGHVAQEALPALYQGARLFLYPTLYEGFGLPVLEAMASGVAVITSNNSALKEIAEGYAHVVNPMDVEAMAQAIAHCLADPEHRSALAKLGLRRASDFHWRRAAEKTLEVYRAALAGPSSRKSAGPGKAGSGKADSGITSLKNRGSGGKGLPGRTPASRGSDSRGSASRGSDSRGSGILHPGTHA
jgi:alpha-1,3-rhamnosyl/mannosyltransferase